MGKTQKGIDVSLPVAWIKESVAFPGVFPMRLSHKAIPLATMV